MLWNMVNVSTSSHTPSTCDLQKDEALQAMYKIDA